MSIQDDIDHFIKEWRKRSMSKCIHCSYYVSFPTGSETLNWCTTEELENDDSLEVYGEIDEYMACDGAGCPYYKEE